MNLKVLVTTGLLLASAAPWRDAFAQRAREPRLTSAQLYDAGLETLGAGDTVRALQSFEAAVREDRANSVAWYALGRVASESARRWWRSGIMPFGIPQRLLLADTAFARAVALEPDSVSWYAQYADFLFSAHATDITRAIRILNAGLKASERAAITTHNSTIANQLGLMWWRRYEAIANRSWTSPDKGLTHGEFILRWYAYPDYLRFYAQKLDPPTGVANFEIAYGYFRQAMTLDPDSELAFRHLAMALVEQSRWEELVQVAQRASERNPSRAWPHLALGLGLHRTGAMADANEAFDRGFALLPSELAASLLSIQRVTSPARTAAVPFGGGDSTSAQAAATFWGTANPSLLIPGNAVYTEFRARVVHAELRWSNEETSRHGADSDRGDVFIRWGPPDDIANFGGMVFVSEGWLYRQFRFNFFFSAAKTYGTAFMMPIYRSNVYEPVLRRFPAAWNNLDIARYGQFDIPITAYRFRGTGDSLQTALWASIPVGALHWTMPGSPRDIPQPSRGVTRLQATALDAQWNRTVAENRTDSSAIADSSTATVVPVVLTMPAAAKYVRVDALSDIAATGERRVAKGILDVPNDMRRGFSISDLVVSRDIRENRPSPARWSDFTFAPLPRAAITRGDPLDLLWEVYDPSVRDAQARYRVAVRVERKVRQGVRAVAARVVDGILGARLQTSADAPLSITYERAVPPTSVAIERLRLDLGNAEAGDYAVAVTVTDLDTQRIMTRSYAFSVVNARRR